MLLPDLENAVAHLSGRQKRFDERQNTCAPRLCAEEKSPFKEFGGKGRGEAPPTSKAGLPR